MFASSIVFIVFSKKTQLPFRVKLLCKIFIIKIEALHVKTVSKLNLKSSSFNPLLKIMFETRTMTVAACSDNPDAAGYDSNNVNLNELLDFDPEELSHPEIDENDEEEDEEEEDKDENEYKRKYSNFSEIGLSTEVVKTLLAELKTVGHTILTDNWYGNFNIFHVIKQAGHYSILMLCTLKIPVTKKRKRKERATISKKGEKTDEK